MGEWVLSGISNFVGMQNGEVADLSVLLLATPKSQYSQVRTLQGHQA